MVLLHLANIHHWMGLHGFRQFKLAGIVPNDSEYGKWSVILWLEGDYLSFELEIPGR